MDDIYSDIADEMVGDPAFMIGEVKRRAAAVDWQRSTNIVSIKTDKDCHALRDTL